MKASPSTADRGELVFDARIAADSVTAGCRAEGSAPCLWGWKPLTDCDARKTAPRRARLLRLGRWAFIAAFVACLLLDWSLSNRDVAAIRNFNEGVDRWQTNPEFRAVAIDYCNRGSEAMSIHPAMVPAARVIMAIRSIPGLPKEFAINPTLELHYRNFTRGPLCAYLHLCSEQDLPDYVPLVEALGRKTEATAADERAFLDDFKMDFGVTKDAGALQSVSSLIHDAGASRRFSIRQNIPELLKPHIAALAGELHVPPNPADMTIDQQQAVLERLDDYVRVHDGELWRTKQVSDFCGGIWAQVFGPPYTILLVPAVKVHTASEYVLMAFIIVLMGRCLRGAGGPSRWRMAKPHRVHSTGPAQGPRQSARWPPPILRRREPVFVCRNHRVDGQCQGKTHALSR